MPRGSKAEYFVSYEKTWWAEEYGLDIGMFHRRFEKPTAEEIELIKADMEEYVPSNLSDRYIGLEKAYPSIEDMAFISRGGEVTKERIDGILKREEVIDPGDLRYVLRSAVLQDSPGILDLAGFFLHEFAYDTSACRFYVLSELFKIPMTDELRDFLIDIMVDIEDRDPKNASLIFERV